MIPGINKYENYREFVKQSNNKEITQFYKMKKIPPVMGSKKI